MKPNDLDTLRWMLAPIGTEDFLANYWEKKPLVLSRERPDYYRDVLTLDDVDRILTTRQFSHPTIRLVTAARETKLEDFTFRDGRVDTRRLLRAFAQGHTVIINQLEFEQPRLMEFCRGLEREISTRMQANIYLTPKNAQGFKPHYDSHDVFILQVHGTKHWLLYDTPLELPMRGQGFRPEEVPTGPVSAEITLRPGDLLYIPRGLMHDARTTGEDSLHITAGVLITTFSELLLEAVGHAAVSDVALRRGLPVGFAQAGFDRTTAVAELRALFQKVVANFDPNALFDQAADDLIGTRVALLEGQISQLVRLDAIGPETRVGARPQLIYRLRETAEHVVLSVFGSDLRLPLHAAPALRFALENQAFAVHEMPGALDGPGKVVLARRLVREGVLRQL